MNPTFVPIPLKLREAFLDAFYKEILQYNGNRFVTPVMDFGSDIDYLHGKPAPTGKGIHRMTITKQRGDKGTRIWFEDREGALSLLRAGALEFHPWASRVESYEFAEIGVVDIEPGAGIDWQLVVDTAFRLREFLKALGYAAWAKTSGELDIHIMVPLKKKMPHEQVRNKFKSLLQEFCKEDSLYVLKSDKSVRSGKIFLDWQRNRRANNVIGAYSPHAVKGFPVAMPVSWQDLAAGAHYMDFTMHSMLEIK